MVAEIPLPMAEGHRQKSVGHSVAFHPARGSDFINGSKVFTP